MAKGQKNKSSNFLITDQSPMGHYRSGTSDDGLAELEEEEVWTTPPSWKAYRGHDEESDQFKVLVEGSTRRHKSPEMRKSRRAPVAASAPINVPSWASVERVNSVYSEEEDEWERVPPHEYLARKYGRGREGSAMSVLEGAGRTLKGRDMSRVRDMVWNRTGFCG